MASMPLRSASILVFACVLLPAGAAQMQSPQGNALALIDAWLALAAVHTASFRTDLQVGGDPAMLPSGRLFCRSQFLGGFTYRPKTYAELTPSERVMALCDPGFRWFVLSAREAADQGGCPGGSRLKPGETPAAANVSVPPNELLRPGPFWIFLPR
jgi:hypothetical protein